jgi:hypothetical protein
LPGLSALRTETQQQTQPALQMEYFPGIPVSDVAHPPRGVILKWRLGIVPLRLGRDAHVTRAGHGPFPQRLCRLDI